MLIVVLGDSTGCQPGHDLAWHTGSGCLLIFYLQLSSDLSDFLDEGSGEEVNILAVNWVK